MRHNESIVSQKKKIIVLGSGPNRIGQGIEFDYCCVHGLLAIKEAGMEAMSELFKETGSELYMGAGDREHD